MELIWRNRSERIEQHLEKIRYVLRVQFGHKVNLVRIRRYCQSLLLLFEVSCVSLLGMAIYNNLVTDLVVLLLYAVYSEMVLLMRFSEFSLHAVLILVFYMELNEVSFRLIMELDKTQFEVKSVRRLSLERLLVLQQLHGQLWNTVRSIECNFELSLVTVLLKFFVDAHILPYWMYVNMHNNINFIIVFYCITEELCKLLAIIVSCLICTRCGRLQRQLRSIYHGLTTDRSNEQLNFYLYRISSQLGQERCQFSAGGFLVINNEILGKFIFGMISYIVVCIQFRISLIDNSPAEAIENSVTDLQFTEGEFA
ncbi:GH23777 [Drosophila grimshawi]|uniref:Gustatory receptor n=2 Tax=Drosophila grimshawi TaxID=7222 RepID=B4JTD6_DROGR|nr:GH23777 [Drosophila grimshawi]